MKEFKFRAWYEELGILQDFTFHEIFANATFCQCIIKTKPEILIPLNQCKIMQYLGEDCKDSKGINICEGDIIRDSEGELHRVIYLQEWGYFHPKGYEEAWPFNWRDAEVIGNIYQNPELLEAIW